MPLLPDFWSRLAAGYHLTRLASEWRDLLGPLYAGFQRRYLDQTGIAHGYPCTVLGGCGHHHEVIEQGEDSYVAISSLGNEECEEIWLVPADLTLETVRVTVLAEAIAALLGLTPQGHLAGADEGRPIPLGDVAALGTSLPVLAFLQADPEMLEREVPRVHQEKKCRLVLLLMSRALVSPALDLSMQEFGIIPLFLDSLVEVREDGSLKAKQRLDAAVSASVPPVLRRTAWFEPDEPTPAAVTPAEEPPRYRFVRKGDFWEITYEGRTFSLRHLERVEYLRMLLERPGTELSAINMVAEVTQLETPPASGNMGETLDREGMRSIKEAIRDTREKLKEAEALGFTADADKWRGELTKLLEYWSASTAKDGRARKTGTASEQFRKRVGNAIARAITDIRKSDENLASHLKQAITRGVFCRYDPTPPVPWTF